VELTAVKKAGKNVWNLSFNDSRSVVAYHYLEFAVGYLLDAYKEVRKYMGFFAGIQSVVNSFFDGGQQGLSGIVEAEQVAVFSEKFTDADIPLLGRHRFGGSGCLGFAFSFASA
jgi:hypothetical protein